MAVEIKSKKEYGQAKRWIAQVSKFLKIGVKTTASPEFIKEVRDAMRAYEARDRTVIGTVEKKETPPKIETAVAQQAPAPAAAKEPSAEPKPMPIRKKLRLYRREWGEKGHAIRSQKKRKLFRKRKPQYRRPK